MKSVELAGVPEITSFIGVNFSSRLFFQNKKLPSNIQAAYPFPLISFVELAGVEPASKRGSYMVSTCLSAD